MNIDMKKGIIKKQLTHNLLVTSSPPYKKHTVAYYYKSSTCKTCSKGKILVLNSTSLQQVSIISYVFAKSPYFWKVTLFYKNTKLNFAHNLRTTPASEEQSFK